MAKHDPPAEPDPELGGLDEELDRNRFAATDPRSDELDRYRAAVAAQAIAHCLRVLTGKAVALGVFAALAIRHTRQATVAATGLTAVGAAITAAALISGAPTTTPAQDAPPHTPPASATPVADLHLPGHSTAASRPPPPETSLRRASSDARPRDPARSALPPTQAPRSRPTPSATFKLPSPPRSSSIPTHRRRLRVVPTLRSLVPTVPTIAPRGLPVIPALPVPTCVDLQLPVVSVGPPCLPQLLPSHDQPHSEHLDAGAAAQR